LNLIQNLNAYYYIDDVSVESLGKEIIPKEIQEEEIVVVATPIKEGEVYIFKNLLFEFDKAILIETSVKE